MSFRFKGELIIIEGKRTRLVKQPLPETPLENEIIIDEADDKFKVWNKPLNKWIVLDNLSPTGKRIIALVLNRNGNANNVWLSLSDHGVPSNTVPWTPPWDCKVMKVLMTNKNDGSTNDPMVTRLQAYYKDFDESGNIKTTSNSGWYVISNGSNSEQIGDNGRHWIYDNSSEGDLMYKSKKYGFRFWKTDGNGIPNDAYITIILEEV